MLLLQPWCWRYEPTLFETEMKSTIPKRIPPAVFCIKIKHIPSDPFKCVSVPAIWKTPRTGQLHTAKSVHIYNTHIGHCDSKIVEVRKAIKKNLRQNRRFLGQSAVYITKQALNNNKKAKTNISKWSCVQPWVFWIEFNRNRQTVFVLCLHVSSFFDRFHRFSQVCLVWFLVFFLCLFVLSLFPCAY